MTVLVRQEPCARGTVIVAVDLPPFYAEAVAYHVRQMAHRLWAVRIGYSDGFGRWRP